MIAWLDPRKAPHFPDTRLALKDPEGLLAAGGKLNNHWLLVAYRQGIFPWFSAHEPILWWSPAPRTVLLPETFHTSRSLQRQVRKQRYHITRNQSFAEVVRQCAQPRKTQSETWIVDRMIEAYINMFKAGFAESFEYRDENNQLLGGIYGVSLGRIFFGESMYSRASNASKLCLKYIIECGDFELIDCQMNTAHLQSLGSIQISRPEFEMFLDRFV
ncbi:MAG: leucyl/phenylalanyl-tRNA--protein transferase [Gammaproteobacteria bacterium]|nr:leucyl/phenylalanyl-tRNA--protein transferase [Gammaproteobacteria bacterium]